MEKKKRFKFQRQQTTKRKQERKKSRKENTNKYSKLALEGARAAKIKKETSTLVKKINTLYIFIKSLKCLCKHLHTMPFKDLPSLLSCCVQPSYYNFNSLFSPVFALPCTVCPQAHPSLWSSSFRRCRRLK